MNYSLNLNLTGADQIDATLDRLLDKVGKVGTGQKVSFDDFLTKGMGEDTGEKMGESIGNGIAKGGNKAYQAWLKKAANETERLARALTGGNWNYTPPEHQKEWYEKGMPGMQGPDLGGIMRKESADKMQKDRESFGKNISLLAGPMMNPGSPLTTMFAGRQAFSALNTQTGQGMLGKFGLSGTGGAAAGAGVLIAAATAVGFALKGLEKIVKAVADAYEHARQNYAKSLTSGLGLDFTIKRGQLASIMGVSETEVIKFGAAMAYLNPKLESSSYYLSKTNYSLTATSWEFKIVGENAKALAAVLADEVSSAIRLLARSFSAMVIGATKLADSKLFKFLMSVTPIGSGVQLMNDLEKLTGSGNAPGISGRMNQLSASSWEKMGLVIGGGGTNTTNELIRKSNQYLAKIASYAATPRANQGLGMDPSTGNP